jgi:hypothetical protein
MVAGLAVGNHSACDTCRSSEAAIVSEARAFISRRGIDAEPLRAVRYDEEWVVVFKSKTGDNKRPGDGGFTVTLDHCGNVIGMKKAI